MSGIGAAGPAGRAELPADEGDIAVALGRFRATSADTYRDGGTIEVVGQGAKVRWDGAFESPTRGRFFVAAGEGREREMTADERRALLGALEGEQIRMDSPRAVDQTALGAYLTELRRSLGLPLEDPARDAALAARAHEAAEARTWDLLSQLVAARAGEAAPAAPSAPETEKTADDAARALWRRIQEEPTFLVVPDDPTAAQVPVPDVSRALAESWKKFPEWRAKYPENIDFLSLEMNTRGRTGALREKGAEQLDLMERKIGITVPGSPERRAAIDEARACLEAWRSNPVVGAGAPHAIEGFDRLERAIAAAQA